MAKTAKIWLFGKFLNFMKIIKNLFFGLYFWEIFFVSKICIYPKEHNKQRISYIWHFVLGNCFHPKFHNILIFTHYEKIHFCLKNSKKAKFFDSQNYNLDKFLGAEFVFNTHFDLPFNLNAIYAFLC